MPANQFHIPMGLGHYSPAQSARVPTQFKIVSLTGHDVNDASTLDAVSKDGWEEWEVVPPSNHNVHASIIFTRPDPEAMESLSKQQAISMEAAMEEQSKRFAANAAASPFGGEDFNTTIARLIKKGEQMFDAIIARNTSSDNDVDSNDGQMIPGAKFKQ